MIQVTQNAKDGVTIIDFTLEPERFNQLSSEIRLTFDEFVDAINEFVDSEEDDWTTLRLKDQISLTNEKLIEKTILKYAKERLQAPVEKAGGVAVTYLNRFDEEDRFIGDAITVSVTFMPGVY